LTRMLTTLVWSCEENTEWRKWNVSSQTYYQFMAVIKEIRGTIIIVCVVTGAG
jgi:hypothetical protein